MSEDKKMSEDKLQWMYKGISGLVDREEYLLGRKVDKTFELLEQEEKQSKGDFNVSENDFTSTLFTKNALSSSTVTVDLNAKVREDPLYEIRKKQVEERKKIIENPIKMKRIKQLLEAALKEESHSSNSESDSDNERRRRDRRHSRDRNNDRHRRHTSHSKSYRESSRFDRFESRHSSSESRKRSEDHRRSSHRSRSNERRKRLSPPKDEVRKNKYDDYRKKSSKPAKTKLSAEELERKRNEMLQNASWREEQRKKNVESYTEEEKKEEIEMKGKNAAFLKPLINSALDTDSVEKRIKQKIFTAQREHNAMDKSFARR